MTWRQAALCIGEQLVSVGPDDYYNFTAHQWFDWAHTAIATTERKDQMIAYILPDGRSVQVPYDVCHAAFAIDFTLADGRIVLAVIAKGQR